MPPLGAHLSIAGGHHRALLAGHRLGCEVIQMFTKSCGQWRAAPLDRAQVRRFHQTRDRVGPLRLLGHAAYLINLASAGAAVRERSVHSLVTELRRAEQLGLEAVVVHPGSHRGAGIRRGLARVARALDRVCLRTSACPCRILLETAAGQGDAVGSTFKQLAWVLERMSRPERVGVCLDTCHMFAAGYDLRTARPHRYVLAEFDRFIGLDRVGAVHLNDSKRGLGSRVDRHEHIGQGRLGLSAFRRMLAVDAFQHVPMCIETPKGHSDGDRMDMENLRVLGGLKNSG